MLFISPESDYPRHIGDIQLANKGWQPEDDLPENWQLVMFTDRPEIGNYQVCYEEFPKEIDNVLSQNWQVREMTDEEKSYKDAPANAKAKLIELGLTELEVSALVRGLVR